MKALIVSAHPDPTSLTHAVAAAIAGGIAAGSGQVEIVDLAEEGFDPRFGMADRAVHQRTAPPPADVAREQARLERANALVLVYPVYWWSMPALLKGWIDRVFTNGWAFEDGPGGQGLIKKLGWLQIHLVGLAGADEALYERRGYRIAMNTQADLGIFGYCGAPVRTSEFLFGSETEDPARLLAAAERIGRDVLLRTSALVETPQNQR